MWYTVYTCCLFEFNKVTSIGSDDTPALISGQNSLIASRYSVDKQVGEHLPL